MRSFGTNIDNHLNSLNGLDIRTLFYVWAKNRETSVTEELGLWDGSDIRVFNINGENRTYTGAGSLISLPQVSGEIGLDVRIHSVNLSGISPEVLQAIYQYDSRLAPVEIHQVYFDPEKGIQIGDPVRIIKGWIDEFPLPKSAIGETSNLSVSIASASRSLTKTLTVKKSDEAQRRIDANDKGREYSSISGVVGVFWGILNSRAFSSSTNT